MMSKPIKVKTIYHFGIKPKAIWNNIPVFKTNWLIPNYIFYNNVESRKIASIGTTN